MDKMENGSVAVVEFDLKGLTRAAKRALGQYASLSRKGAMALHEAGRSLSAIKDHKPGRWGRWVRDEGIALTTADQAVALDRFDPSGEKFKGMTITEAKELAGIIKSKSIVVGPHLEPTSTLTTSAAVEQVGVEENVPVKVEDQSEAKTTASTEEPAKATSTVEVPPVHEPESVLRRLVQFNHALAEIAKLDIPAEERDLVDVEITNAIDMLNGLRTTAQFKVVA